MLSTISRYGVIAAVLMTAIFVLPAHAQFGTNLLTNGGAEAGLGSNDGGAVPVPGWTVASGNFTAVQYGTSGGFPASTDPGPADRGLNFFAGGDSEVSFASAFQNLSVSVLALPIDAGTVGFDASGFFGGFSGQEDNAKLHLTFLDVDNTTLGDATVGSVTPIDREGFTGILFRELTGVVPVGTRTITASLEMTRLEGSYNDGYADNLSVKLVNGVSVPEAGALPLLSLGSLGLIGLIARRRFIKGIK